MIINEWGFPTYSPRVNSIDFAYDAQSDVKDIFKYIGEIKEALAGCGVEYEIESDDCIFSILKEIIANPGMVGKFMSFERHFLVLCTNLPYSIPQYAPYKNSYYKGKVYGICAFGGDEPHRLISPAELEGGYKDGSYLVSSLVEGILPVRFKYSFYLNDFLTYKIYGNDLRHSANQVFKRIGGVAGKICKVDVDKEKNTVCYDCVCNIDGIKYTYRVVKDTLQSKGGIS